MAIRVYPFGRRIGAVNDDEVNIVVQSLTARLTADDALYMTERHLSLWRDYLTPAERGEFCDMARPHRKMVQNLHPADVWDAIGRARPDLYDILSRNGGKAWLHTQASEIKTALLRGSA